MKKNWKTWQMLAISISIAAILYWLLLTLAYGSVSFSIMFLLGGIVLGSFTLVTWHFQITMKDILPKWLYRTGLGLIVIGLSIFIGIESIILYQGNTSSNEYGDYIVVLGAGLLHGDELSASLLYRLEKAVEVHKKTPETPIIVSGGQGADETISEAQAMKTYLVSQGIPEDIILMEDKSTNTSENLRYSKEIMEAHGTSTNQISLITNGFHMHRASFLAKQEGLQVYRQPAKGLWSVEVCFYVREFFGVVRAYILKY